MSLVWLPGFGTDERVLSLQLQAFPQSWVVPWLDVERGETLGTYGGRVAALLRKRYGEEPVVIAGVSMGGMIALEVAKHGGFNLQKVLLICSCTSPAAIDVGQRWFARLTSHLPESWIASMRSKLPRSFYDKLGDLSQEHQDMTRAMFLETPTSRLRWGCGAMATWQGVDPAALSVPVRAVHGDHDLLIRSKKVTPDVWIEGAGHAANLTHPDQINAFIRDSISDASTPHQS